MSTNHRALLAEFFCTAALLVAVVGSGIAGEQLSAGNNALALLANAAATGVALYVLITMLAPVSGAHLNPLITFATAFSSDRPLVVSVQYVLMQLSGAIVGVWLTHAMFDLAILEFGTRARTGLGQWISEVVATVGLVITIAGFDRLATGRTGAAVGAYIAAAYWFTASTSFANPAVTIARMLTDTFSGIRPADVPGFVAAQCIGLGIALGGIRLLFPSQPGEAFGPDRK
jgi:glycerol uptake facilitator-like aquaporin